MAFLSEIKDKITKAGETALKKGRELADVTKINFAIAEEEKKRDGVYCQIGKLFVEKVEDRAEGEFLPLVDEANAILKKIEELKSSLKDIKGISICPKCNTELPADAIFCNVCGEKVKESEGENNEN